MGRCRAIPPRSKHFLRLNIAVGETHFPMDLSRQEYKGWTAICGRPLQRVSLGEQGGHFLGSAAPGEVRSRSKTSPAVLEYLKSE